MVKLVHGLHQKDLRVVELEVKLHYEWVAFGQHRGDLDGHGAIMRVMRGGSGTLLSAVRPC